jgi:hypothetical protein
MDGGWNSNGVQAQMKYLWKEKMKIAATFKEQLNLRTDIPINIIDNICAYEVRCFDLEIRKQELISIKTALVPSYGQPLPSSDSDKPYQSLKELEIELVKKQTILQSLNDLTLARITWIDKAFPVKPMFRSNLLYTFGFSFGAALFVAFIIGLLCAEYNSYKRNN